MRCGLAAACEHTHADTRGQAVSLHQSSKLSYAFTQKNTPAIEDTVDPRAKSSPIQRAEEHASVWVDIFLVWDSSLKCCGCHHPKRTKPILLNPCTRHYSLPPKKNLPSHPLGSLGLEQDWHPHIDEAQNTIYAVQYKVLARWYLCFDTLSWSPNAHLLQSSSCTTACTSTSLVGLTG